MLVLIVDDLAENICLLETLFSGAGYRVVSARNGAEALACLGAAGGVTLIVSDILMPVMDGYQLIRECKNDPEWGKIPFIFYTATYTEKKDEEFAMALGADRFIIKPQEPERFLRIIQEVLDLPKYRGEAATDKPFLDREAYLLAHNERLIWKLDRKVAELAKINLSLRQSEEKYRRLVDNANEVIVVAQDGRLVFANPMTVRLTGYSESELISRPFTEFVHPDDRQRVLERYTQRVEGNISLPRYSFRLIAKDGTVKWVEISAVLIDWESRPATLNFIVDTTEAKQAEKIHRQLEAQFQQAQKMESVGRLAGGVAHDFNNMLSVILGYAEMAMNKVAPDEPLHADLEQIHSAARRSRDITRQLLAFARRQTIAPKVMDLNETMEGMLKTLRRLIGEDIDLAWRPGTGLWPVKIDPAQTNQILANLCVNARDAIPDVGKLTIETENITFDEAYCADHAGFSPGEFVLLAVSDDGSGMDKETLDRIFEPFFTTKGVGRGTGLGLATVYGIVKQNSGFINVYSEPERGTTFKIYLPRHTGSAMAATAESPAQIEPGRGETVLLVEDEAAILKMSRMMLEGLGYKVLASNDPAEALALATAHAGEIHLLMTDVVMPGMNGRDLSERIRAIRPAIKCLFMSGYTANVIAHRGVLDEGVWFIQKPFSKKELAARIRRALEGGKIEE
jgi:two-component system, cell cycle sensor histidine kinase and response regulator CckA